jgi:hypothetical protein
MIRIRVFGAVLLAGALSACSGGGGLTTASLLGTPAEKPPVDEPTERALNAAAVSVRASKCGYNFNPNKLRDSYLAYEASAGASPEQMAKLTQSYDFTRTTVSKQISNPEEYCSPDRTRQVSLDLNKQLAGDFRAPPRKPADAYGWWGEPGSQKPMDREAIFDPLAPR